MIIEKTLTYRDMFLASLFTVLALRISRMANHFEIQLQQYADDTRLYVALSPTEQSGKVILEDCLASVHALYCFNDLAITPDEYETIMFG